MAAQLPPLMPLPLVAHPAQNAEQVPSSAQPCPLSCQSAFLTFIPPLCPPPSYHEAKGFPSGFSPAERAFKALPEGSHCLQ